MSVRLLLVALCIVCVFIFTSSSSPDSQDGQYRFAEYLSRLELDSGVYDDAPAWIIELISDRMSGGALSAELACSLSFKPDNWTAAGVLLDLILDDEVVARVRTDQNLEITYTRAVRYLRPAIVTRFYKTSMSPSDSERMKLIWWADGLMRLFPYAQGAELLRTEWEAEPRPWGTSNILENGPRCAEGGSSGDASTNETVREVYREFLTSAGVPLKEVVPTAIMCDHLEYIDSYRSAEHWYWKGMEASWLAGSSLGPFLPPGSCSMASALYETAADMSDDKFHTFLKRTEYLRPWYPLYLTIAPRGTVQPELASLLALDRLLVLYSPESDKEWQSNET